MESFQRNVRNLTVGEYGIKTEGWEDTRQAVMPYTYGNSIHAKA